MSDYNVYSAQLNCQFAEGFTDALNLVESKIKQIRSKTPNLPFDKNKLAEVEINKFFLDGETVDRVMIVLRSNGCKHYKTNGGCSMCAHLNGSPLSETITHQNYVEQWESVITGAFLEDKEQSFNLNDYPVVCVYNLGSLLNSEEIQLDTVRYIFASLNKYKGIKKVIIESRAEYVTLEVLTAIKEVYDGVIEVGIGVESTNYTIRELCHHKAIQDATIIATAVNNLHKCNMKALAYVNFKPVFLTEQEAINDAIMTATECILKYNFDAVSIEPTSLQENSLANHMYNLGLYRVPWLWSLRDIIHGIYENVKYEKIDIRLGGYFDEQVLSGSQGVGFSGRNEIFPHMTSSNCSHCTNKFVEAIKRFNMTYNVQDLDSIEACEHCYSLWLDSKRIRDSRSIVQRITDIFK